ncbi:hypothetical protein TTHERM_000302101 (macronuclear) [Tetrahymena thermophila SB210]|uniref:Uncharacterized protein n=1 Tax=Tetrahymena thermophila (strain SB210) TaxID=312017 RepID=W7XDH2_TETTS|nr:hypothetical protein TTHERM_000302101 [Tetrahymena thermophila SB210]EWS71876.1 hypothetical protein TTHERM_000302101 [Tetrahymena thermophila SB210]|eukprot:XP_012655620.1 hypothetical protein TTHERM_000302101 [Tetrahymena thermophila SB210]
MISRILDQGSSLRYFWAFSKTQASLCSLLLSFLPLALQTTQISFLVVLKLLLTPRELRKPPASDSAAGLTLINSAAAASNQLTISEAKQGLVSFNFQKLSLPSYSQLTNNLQLRS